jgi:hypothetical protein
MLANVILAGGGACLGPTDSALPDFVREHTEAILHQHTPGWRVKVLSPNMAERSVCSWLGGSISGTVSWEPFMTCGLLKRNTRNGAAAIVNRKCP